MRFASRPPCGPATSSSDPTLPALAASEPAPSESAPLPTCDCDDGPGLGFLLEQPALLNAMATIRMISIFRIPTPPFCRSCGNKLLRERSPGGLPDFALVGLQPQSNQAIHRNSGQHGAAAL